ncbi:hypothetical protein [Hymenobacter swuensis]|uniref:PEGA domain-containing protein n=1 Tax=Hymenobacter swuensis DY53 TaxID=1227739 RepID=W8F286_9BACT|nr:hypothetical protein [Hymenobacter swuensis]AHJ99494.1 hypothetical protein Hsw_3899 [Hymenobacter swuensis DY53]
MRFFLLLFGVLLLTLRAAAQDVILQINGEERTGKVLAITPELVTYVTPTADTLRLAAIQVFLIRYANGTKEVLNHPAATPTAAPVPGLTKEAAYAQGRRDARTHFRAPGAFWGTYAATVGTIGYLGVGGVATGVAVSMSEPKPKNFIVPESSLLQNPDYVAGYRRQAQKKKLGNAAGGFGAGVVTVGALVVVLFFITGGFHHI